MKLNYAIARTNSISITQMYFIYDTFLTGNVFKCLFLQSVISYSYETKTQTKFITIGEILLRLSPPNYGKIIVSNMFEANYGGSEANIALALSNLGVDSTFFSIVPDNPLGKAAIRMLRSNDVHCTPVILSTEEETPAID